MEKPDNMVHVVLRVGVAFAFIYPAVAAFLEPLSWIGFFPAFIRDIVDSETILLSLVSLFQIGIALWIIAGRKIFIPSVIASIYLCLIIIFNLELLDIVFRDIPILLMAIALALIHYGNRSEKQPTTRRPDY